MSLSNIINEFKENNFYLLYEIEVSDVEYDALITYTRNRIESLDVTIPPREDIPLSITLVQIAVREYKEGNYWGYFDEIFPNITSSKRNYLAKLFVATLKNNNLFYIEQSDDERTQYVENIKAHSLVPNFYLSGYYDFMFSFYEGNLLRNISEKITDDILSLQEFMQHSLSENGDVIRLENTNIKKAKTYRLLKSTRRLFASMPIEHLESLFRKHLNIIDNYYYDGQLPIGNDRFTIGFKQWADEFDKSLSEKERNVSIRKRSPLSHKPYYKFNHDIIELVIPQQKFRDNEFLNNALLTINKEAICYLDIFSSFGIKVSEEKTLICNDLFEQQDILISSIGEKHYTIQESNFRLFNENWESISTPKRGINYLVVKKGTIITASKQGIISSPFSVQRKWDIFQIDLDEDCFINVSGETISLTRNFTGKTDTEQFSSRKYYIENENGERINAFYRHIVISFVIKKHNFDRTILYCNDQKFKSINIPETTKTFEIDGKPDLLGVEINLDNILVPNDGEYIIWIDEPNKQPREIIRYALITNLWCRSEYYLYYFQDEARIITNGSYSISPINCHYSTEENVFIFTFKDGKTVAKFNICVSNKYYIVNVPLNTVEYNERPEYIWFSNLPNLIYIKFPGAINCALFLESNSNCKIEGELKNGIYEFDITELNKAIMDNSEIVNTLLIEWEYSNVKTRTLFNILKSLDFKFFNICNKDNCLCVNTLFRGDAKCIINVKNHFTHELLVDSFTIECGENILYNLPSTEVYDIERICVEEDAFGFNLNVLSICTYKNVFVGDFDVNNSFLNIISAYTNNKKISFDYWYSIKNIEKYNDFSYMGVLYEQQKTKSSNMKPRILCKQVVFRWSEERRDNIIVQFLSEDELDFPYYDNLKKRLVSSEMIKNSVDYDRFSTLFDDETVFVIKIRRFQ